MARVQVVLSTCDSCHFEERTPLSKGIRRGNYQLPPEWLHVSGNTATATVFEVDLCPDCKGVVLDAAGKGRNKKGRRLKSVG